MPLTLVTGPANAGKAQVVLDAVRANLARGREPRLVVPTRADVEHYQRELAGGGGADGAGDATAGVRVEVFDGLIAEIVRRAGVHELVLTDLARERLLAKLLRDGGGRPVRAGTARALGDLFAELQVRRVAPPRLAAALATAFADAPADLGVDVAALYGAYHRRLERIGRLDAEQRTMRALDRLREQRSLWRSTPVAFYGFDDLTPVQLDAIETLGAVVDAEVTVSLPYEPGRVAFAGRAATFQALAPLAREHRSLPPRSEHYASDARSALSHLERTLFEGRAARAAAAGAVRILCGEDERGELELVAAEVRGLIDGGTAPEEIAVIVRRPERSAELLREVFAGAGIAFACRRSLTFAATPLGRGLVGLLRCVPEPGGGPPGEPADLLAWLRAPGHLRETGFADSLEAVLRQRGVTSVQEARALWEERRWPLETIDRLAQAQARGPAALLERATRELDRLFAAPRLRRAGVLRGPESDDAPALVAGRRALAELRELARFAPAAAPADAAELAEVLEAVALHVGERRGASSAGVVAVLDPLSLRARRVRALFVTGMQEGSFPERARPPALLGEEERQRLAGSTGLLLGRPADVLASERYLLYALLSRPEERLILSWHETDAAGEPASRSLFVDDICDLFADDLQGERQAAGERPAEQGMRADAGAAAALTDGELLRALGERMWSASSLEQWIGCPVKWFVERLLEPATLEPEPEPLARGKLAHAALKDTLERLRAESGSARVTPGNLESAVRLLSDALRENAERHPLPLSPERRAGAQRRLHADLVRYLEHWAETGGALEPHELERGFGFDPEDPRGQEDDLPPLDLGAGVLLRGRIDRVDVGADGDALVIDYKGTQVSRGERWLKDGKIQLALYMHAAEQLLGLRVSGGLYQPLAGKDMRARGAVAAGSEAAESCMGTDVIEPDELQELLAGALAAARTAAGEAARGELEPRPATCAFNGGCSYPAICRCER